MPSLHDALPTSDHRVGNTRLSDGRPGLAQRKTSPGASGSASTRRAELLDALHRRPRDQAALKGAAPLVDEQRPAAELNRQVEKSDDTFVTAVGIENETAAVFSEHQVDLVNLQPPRYSFRVRLVARLAKGPYLPPQVGRAPWRER